MKYLKEYIDFNDFEWEEEDPDMVDIPSGESLEFYKRYIGRKVKIKPSSIFYGKSKNANPEEVVGTIIKTDLGHSNYFIRVEWDSTHTNVYRTRDLMLVD